MLHSIGDWERISDYARDLNQSAREIRDKKLVISAEAQNSYERISDHCSNIAIAVLEEGVRQFTPHEYMEHVKSGNDPVFQQLFGEYQAKYLA